MEVFRIVPKAWKFCCNTKSKNNPLMKLKTLEKQSQRQMPVIPALEVTASSSHLRLSQEQDKIQSKTHQQQGLILTLTLLRNEMTTIKFLLSTWGWQRKRHRQLDLWVPGKKTT